MKKVFVVIVLLAAAGLYGQTDVEAHFNRGNDFFNKQDYDNAIREYSEAIELSPDNATVYHNRGVAYYAKGDYNKAIEDFSTVIRLYPNVFDVYLFRGQAYYGKKDYDRAIADFEAVLRRDPDNANAKNNLEIVRRARGE